jgi:EAL domain-containing protein (putative c-di-GMP-specific phosphodiesterase class I)
MAQARGCHQAQGFHLCRPLPAEEFTRYAAQVGVIAAI